MVNEGEFPKLNGDIFYGKDANIVRYDGYNSDTITYDGIDIGSLSTSIISSNALRKSIIIKNNGSSVIYIGDSGVTNTDGYKVLPKESLYLHTKDAIYAAADSSIGSGTNNTRYIEVQ